MNTTTALLLGFALGFLIVLSVFSIHIFIAEGQIELNLENNLQVGNTSEKPHPAIMNSAIYKDYGSQSHIFGEILNNFTYPISFVKVYAAVQNASGDVIVTSEGFPKETYLKPGQRSGFWILVQEDVPEHSNFTLVSTFDKAKQMKAESLKLDVNLMSLNPVKVVGTVTNLGHERATGVEVSGIFYDRTRHVVDSEQDFVNIYSGLGPGEKGIFELTSVLNYENRDKIKSVALNAESNEYSTMLTNVTN